MSLVRGFLSSVLIALITLIAIDALAFLVFDIKPRGYKPERIFVHSEQYGHFPRANVRDTWYAYSDGSKFEVSLNSEGFTDIERAPGSSKPRIALIGDSTTAMWEAETQSRPQFAIESLLERSHEVLNFGVRGFGTDQTLLVFRDKVSEYKPDIVVYTFCINDIANNADRKGKPWFDLVDGKLGTVQRNPEDNVNKVREQGLSRNWLSEISFSSRVAGAVLQRFTRSKKAPALDEHFELRAYRKDYSDEDTNRLNLTLALLERLNAEVTASGAKLLVVEGFYRPAIGGIRQKKVIEAYGDVFEFDRITKALELSSKQNKFAFTSFAEKIQLTDVDKFTHPSDAMHLNSAGSEAFSRAIVDALKQNDWL